ncbi:MAG: hypothetical protein AAGC56_13030 [Pseudomonadota bacterium]
MGKFILAVLALGLVGCVSVKSGSPYTETGAICDNSGLDSRLVEFRDESRNIKGAIAVGTPSGGGAFGMGRRRTDVGRVYDLTDKLNRFEAEIESKHQAAKASCKIFARCMEKNGYREERCERTLAKWTSADQEFSKLAVELRDIQAYVETTRLELQGDPWGPLEPIGNGQAGPPPPQLNPNECTCDQAVGGLFANCCSNNQ